MMSAVYRGGPGLSTHILCLPKTACRTARLGDSAVRIPAHDGRGRQDLQHDDASGQRPNLARTYTACDVVPELMFVRDNLTFRAIDAVTDPLPPGDLVIVRQVFQHLRNDQIQAILRKFARYRTWIISEHVSSSSFCPIWTYCRARTLGYLSVPGWSSPSSRSR